MLDTQVTILESSLGNILEQYLLMEVSHPDPEYSKPPAPTPPLTIDQAQQPQSNMIKPMKVFFDIENN